MLSKSNHLDFFNQQWDILTNRLLKRLELSAINNLKIVLDAFQNTLLHVMANDMRGVSPEQLSEVLLPMYSATGMLRRK